MPRDFPQPNPADFGPLIHSFLHLEGPLLPILHGFQETFGHVPEAASQPIAEALNLTTAEVHGVMSFYHDFRKSPAGRHVVKLCRAEACQAMGANPLSDAVLRKLGLDGFGMTADGALTVEPVYCLGLCACAPAAMVDGKVVGRLDAGKLDALITGLTS